MSIFAAIRHPGLHAHRPEPTAAPVEERGDPGARYASLEAFREAGGEFGRALSVEHDFGVMWREGTRRRPRYRVAWVEATGELFAEALSEFAHLRSVELLAVVRERTEVERLLSGWESVPYAESTLTWVRRRVTA
jgi:hypothetical protein